jgi:hypothetical protein
MIIDDHITEKHILGDSMRGWFFQDGIQSVVIRPMPWESESTTLAIFLSGGTP